MIKGAIFDVDGVILDSMKVWNQCGIRYLESIGIEADPKLGYRMFHMTLGQGAEYIKDHYSLPYDLEEIKSGMMAQVEAYYFNSPVMKEGARELLTYFRDKGVRMTVASSTNSYCIIAAFKKLGILNYFDEILSCSEGGRRSKSYPDTFFEAAEIMGTDPENTMVFEDGLYSIRTAKEAGFLVTGVYDEISESDQDDIKKLADIYVVSLKELELD